MDTKRYFIATITGDYQTSASPTNAPTLKSYKVQFKLPSQEAALSTICKYLLLPRLKTIYPDCVRFRTHKLVSLEVIGNQPDRAVLQMGIDEMNVHQLADFCILRQIQIDPYKHKDLAAIKTKVQEAWSLKRQNLKDAEGSKEAKEKAEIEALMALNDMQMENEDVIITHSKETPNKGTVAKETGIVKEPAKQKGQAQLKSTNLPPAPEVDPNGTNEDELGNFFDQKPE